MDNLPWIVKTHFDFQDMMHDIFATEFWFQKLMYPLSTVGIVFCLMIILSMYHEIDLETSGQDFL